MPVAEALTDDTDVKRSRKVRRSAPFVCAIVGLVPEVLGHFSDGSWLMAAFSTLVLASNIIALRLQDSFPRWGEVLTLVADSVLAGLTALAYMQAHSKAIHWVWWVACLCFAVASVIAAIRSRRRQQELPVAST